MRRLVNTLMSFVGRGLRWSAWRWTVLEGWFGFGPRQYAVANRSSVAAAKTFLQELDVSYHSRQYFERHLDRIATTVAMGPGPTKTGRVLEIGTYLHILPAVFALKGYREAKGTYFGAKPEVQRKSVSTSYGRIICDVDVALFDAERDRFPYDDGAFDLVVVAEVLEHLNHDPMHMLVETRRILCDGGALLLTTPNCASFSSLVRFFRREHPYQFSGFRDPRASPEPGSRHVREYTSLEVRQLLRDAGFEVEIFVTESEPADPAVTRWMAAATRFCSGSLDDRGDQIYSIARKTAAAGASRQRYPKSLYV